MCFCTEIHPEIRKLVRGHEREDFRGREIKHRWYEQGKENNGTGRVKVGGVWRAG